MTHGRLEQSKILVVMVDWAIRVSSEVFVYDRVLNEVPTVETMFLVTNSEVHLFAGLFVSQVPRKNALKRHTRPQ